MGKTERERMAKRVVTDVGGAFAVAMAYIGDRLGLFRALADAGSATSDGLAAGLGLNERYVREWLRAMVAAEYVEYDVDSASYSMTPAQAAVLADEGGAGFLAGAFQFTVPSLALVPRVIDAFRDGGGVPFDQLGGEIPEGIHRMHRPAFEHLLVQRWLPAVPGLVAALDAGIEVLDLGCGIGMSSVVIARAFPRSRVIGLDLDEYSVSRARELADVDNVEFVTTPLAELPDTARFRLVCAFDCIHDMVDPVSELAQIRRLLGDDGQLLWMEPTGSSNPTENRTPAGKMRANLSSLHCLTVSLAAGGAGLGTIIGEQGARALAADAQLSRFERLPVDDPLHLFFLVRP